MRNKIIASIIMAVTIAFSTVAQDFRQPYPIGTPLKDNPNFIGQAYLTPMTEVKDLNVPMFNVTFEPGCRNSWHRHSGGQLLIATPA